MKIIFFNCTYDYWRYYLENAKVSYDVELVFGRRIYVKSRLLKLVYKLHCSERINRVVPLPLKRIWCNRMVPLEKNYPDKVTFIIYTSYLASFPFDPYYFINYLRGHFNCRIAFMYGNTVESENKFFDGESLCPMADLVCSYNTEDLGHYNLKIHPTLLFDLDLQMIPLKDREYDVFFVGQEKGRGEEINHIFNKLTNLGLKCEFFIVGKTDAPRINGIHYSDWIPYDFIVGRLKQSKCVLNLLWEGSKGVTLRDIEAFNNGCFILKNYVDESIYDLLPREQVLTVDDINQELADIIKNTDSAFRKKGEQKSFDMFYQWVIDNCWKQ